MPFDVATQSDNRQYLYTGFLYLTLIVVDELGLKPLTVVLGDQDPPGVVASAVDDNEAGDLLGEDALGVEVLGLEVHDLLGAVLPTLAEGVVVEVGELADAGATADVAEETVVELDGLPVEDTLLLGGGEAAARLVLNVEQDVAVLVLALVDGESDVGHGNDLAGQPVDALDLEDLGRGLGQVIVLLVGLVYRTCVTQTCENLVSLTTAQEPLRSWTVLEAGAAIVSTCEWFCGIWLGKGGEDRIEVWWFDECECELID